MKPLLSNEHKVARFNYCYEEIAPLVDADGSRVYKDMYDRVDVDEKWFYLTTDQERYIILDSDFSSDEEENQNENVPVRRIRHKSYITKVQFLCAQARPRWDPHRNAYWDGKIGIWSIGSFSSGFSTRTKDAG